MIFRKILLFKQGLIIDSDTFAYDKLDREVILIDLLQLDTMIFKIVFRPSERFWGRRNFRIYSLSEQIRIKTLKIIEYNLEMICQNAESLKMFMINDKKYMLEAFN